MSLGPPRRRRARAVADAPVVELLGRADDLAKGWLLALIEEAPLEEMPAILASELARDGPRLCAAVVRALADDTDLDRLRSGAALEQLAASAGELAGAHGAEAAAHAIDALGAVIWSGVRAELSDPGADQVAELAERLAVVLEQVRSAVLRRMNGREHGNHAAPRRDERPLAPAGSPEAPERAVVSEPRERAVVSEPRERAVVSEPRERAVVSEPATPRAARVVAPDPNRPPLWLAAFEDEVERALRIGSPLSLLLTELDEADRMLAVEGATGAEAMFGRFGQSVRSAVRRQDTLACETDTRAWIIARDTGRVGAQTLAERVAEAVRGSPSWRGAPVGVTVGIAVLREDGHDAADLIEAAEEARFLAQASGITIARRNDPTLGVGDPGPTAS